MIQVIVRQRKMEEVIDEFNSTGEKIVLEDPTIQGWLGEHIDETKDVGLVLSASEVNEIDLGQYNASSTKENMCETCTMLYSDDVVNSISKISYDLITYNPCDGLGSKVLDARDTEQSETENISDKALSSVNSKEVFSILGILKLLSLKDIFMHEKYFKHVPEKIERYEICDDGLTVIFPKKSKFWTGFKLLFKHKTIIDKISVLDGNILPEDIDEVFASNHKELYKREMSKFKELSKAW